jgi:glucose-6-phosphate 1-dehydrogenase
VPELTRRGQYKGYRKEVGNKDSTTETFAAIQLNIGSPRWKDVPITLWTGKSLGDHFTEVAVHFDENILTFRIQPNEGIGLRLLAKKPGFDADLQKVALNFSYHTEFQDHGHPNAYERVLVDAVRGDHTLFATGQEVLEAWRVVQPVLDEWAKSADDLHEYKPGSDGRSLLQ